MVDPAKITSAYPQLEPSERRLIKVLVQDTKGQLDGELAAVNKSWNVRELGNMVVRMNKKFGARVIDRIPKRGNAGTAYRIKDEFFQALKDHVANDELFT